MKRRLWHEHEELSMTNKSDSSQSLSHTASGIIRVSNCINYAMISNDLLRDKRLSWAARGVLTYLLSHTDNWTIRISDLIRQSPAGRDAVYTIIKELKKFGYIRMQRRRRGDGTFDWVSTIYNSPIQTEDQTESATYVRCENPKDSPYTEKPYMDDPYVVQPNTVEPDTEKAVITKDYNDLKLIDLKPMNEITHTHLPGAQDESSVVVTDRKRVGVSETALEETSTSEEPVTNSKPSSQKMASAERALKPDPLEDNKQISRSRSCSRYTFEECLAYAEHLHKTKQGVNTPPAFAKKILATGSDDELITAFIEAHKQKETGWSLPPGVKASDCPDCHGTGYFYPGENAKGVARCKHLKLRGVITPDEHV
jgi:hypothetical protein